MNNKSNIAIAIGLMCTLLTAAIVVQLNTIKEATKVVGTAYAEQSLKDEVLRWKEKYENRYKELEETVEELEQARQEVTKENERGSELETKLSESNKLLGLTDLTGSGLVITLSDNTGATTIDAVSSVEDLNSYIVHNTDLLDLVNELFNAGAEAISINGQRIMPMTSITCTGAVITVNETKLSSPFEIKAIGNPESLYGIARPGGVYELILKRGAIGKIEKSNNLTVEKYSGTITSKYMKNAE